MSDYFGGNGRFSRSTTYDIPHVFDRLSDIVITETTLPVRLSENGVIVTKQSSAPSRPAADLTAEETRGAYQRTDEHVVHDPYTGNPLHTYRTTHRWEGSERKEY